MATLDAFRRECIRHETGVEAGYVNDPSDLGGETNHGITKKLADKYYQRLNAKFGWDGNMRNLTEDMAYWIYEVEFWHPMWLDNIYAYSESLCFSMFRWGLKSGAKRPVTALQETLNCLNNRQAYWRNIVVDGYIGSKTMSAIDSLIAKRGRDAAMVFLVSQMNADQLAWMKHITLARSEEINEKYYWGWGVRIIREVTDYANKYGIPKI